MDRAQQAQSGDGGKICRPSRGTEGEKRLCVSRPAPPRREPDPPRQPLQGHRPPPCLYPPLQDFPYHLPRTRFRRSHSRRDEVELVDSSPVSNSQLGKSRGFGKKFLGEFPPHHRCRMCVLPGQKHVRLRERQLFFDPRAGIGRRHRISRDPTMGGDPQKIQEWSPMRDRWLRSRRVRIARGNMMSRHQLADCAWPLCFFRAIFAGSSFG